MVPVIINTFDVLITEHHRNSHTIDAGSEFKLYCMSDIHWDNPHCQRDILRKHLNLAKKENAKVAINGDFFCLMQGKYDPRRSKKDIRLEHNVANYLDAVINDAIKWFAPYKDVIIFIGYGNHETSVLKNVETDPLRRFVEGFNAAHQPETPITLGGYGGWLTLQFKRTTCRKSYMIYYFHGSGGGGPVTKGTIQHQRQMADTEGADAIWMGHVHELYTMYQSKKTLDFFRMPIIKEVLHMRTGTYKEEFEDGYAGWHVERGAPPKPLGCVTISFRYAKTSNNQQNLVATPNILMHRKTAY